MTNEDIVRIAMRQSAVDLGCKPEDFLLNENKIVISKKNAKARKYLEMPFACNLVSYDKDNLVGLAACSADCEDMWHIGVDVLPQYRRQGIAASLTSALALEILREAKSRFIARHGRI